MVSEVTDIDVLDGGGGGVGGYTPPNFVSGDWGAIATFAAGHTQYRSVNFAALDSTLVDLNGTYSILAVTAGAITLADPTDVNINWSHITVQTQYASPTLSTNGERWIGPFTMMMTDADGFCANFSAQQGMYRVDSKGKKHPTSCTALVEVTPINQDGTSAGYPQSFYCTVSSQGAAPTWFGGLVEAIAGGSADQNPKGQTLFGTLPVVGPFTWRARRITPADYNTTDTIVDEIRWQDGYGTAVITVPHFGDITTVHTRTYATAGASTVKERKFNCVVTRKIPVRNEDDTFGPELQASQNAAQIICAMALDPFIGGRQLYELDVPQLFDTVEDVVSYFNVEAAGQFNYTFDEDNISFEDMVATVAQTVFCSAFRQGSKLRLFFEKMTNDSSVLFNHRNKEPGSEKRTITFGNANDYDGVELDYVSPTDGSKITLYAPEDRSAVKPKKLEVKGIRDGKAAFLQLMRAFNKIRYQNTATQFNATGEASQLIRGERIDVADNTRSDQSDGEVIKQEGLVLTITQPFEHVDGTDYVIHLQLPSGIVQVIDILPGADEHHIVLQAATGEPLSLGEQQWAPATYNIVGSSDARTTAFIVAEKGPYDKKLVELQAINYDERYYQDDFRFNASVDTTVDTTYYRADSTVITVDRG